jgi:hypothetical protein
MISPTSPLSPNEIPEESLDRLNNLIVHPDDLNTKVPLLKKKLVGEKNSIDSQVMTGVRNQLDDIKAGLSTILRTQGESDEIVKNLAAMEKVCKDQVIEHFDFVKQVCTASSRLKETKAIYDRFDELDGEIQRVMALINHDKQSNYMKSQHILLIHYHLVRLEDFRSQMLFQIKDSAKEVRLLVEKFFLKLDNTVKEFEDFLFNLCNNVLTFVKGREANLVVRLMKIIEFEERQDEKEIELQQMMNSKDDLTRKRANMMNTRLPREMKSYRNRLMNVINESIDANFASLISDDLIKESPSHCLLAADFVIDELLLVNEELVPRFPKKYKIFDFYVLQYHRLIYTMINRILSQNIGAGDILQVVSWVNSYYERMNDRLNVPKELLEPKLLDEKEDALIHEYIKLTKSKVGEWINNLLISETKNFQIRENPPETDARGLYISPGITIDLFHIFRQHIESTSRSSRTKLLADVVTECMNCLLDFQASLSKLITIQVNMSFEKQGDVAGGLDDYVIMFANSCMISCDNLEEISKKLDKDVDEAFKERVKQDLDKCVDGFMKVCKLCYNNLGDFMFNTVKPVITQLFTPKWYEERLVDTVLVTLEDFFRDYQGFLHEYIFGKLVNDIIDRYIVLYIEAMRTRNAKFKSQQGVSEKVDNDLQSSVAFFSKFKAQKRVLKSFEPIEKLIPMFSSSKKMLFLDFYAIWKPYPDFPLTLLEYILTRRDDIDKSAIREVMDTCRKKVKEEKAEGPVTPSVFSKLKE